MIRGNSNRRSERRSRRPIERRRKKRFLPLHLTEGSILPTGRNVLESLQNQTGLELFGVMTADLRPIIDDIANRADEFLAGTRDRAHARAGIEDLITMDYPTLNPLDRTVVVTGVMSVLEDEDFFGTEYVGDPFADADEGEEDGGGL